MYQLKMQSTIEIKSIGASDNVNLVYEKLHTRTRYIWRVITFNFSFLFVLHLKNDAIASYGCTGVSFERYVERRGCVEIEFIKQSNIS